MNKKNNMKILWLKRVVGFLFVSLWLIVFYKILQSGGDFASQAPKCILSTMLIFGSLSVTYKGLEYLEKSR